MYIEQLVNNTTFIVVILSWAVSCLIKGTLVCARERKIDWTRFTGAGGMPSSHSAIVTSLATAVAIHDGVDSTTFVICCALAFIVMYDASGVRRAAGKQASVINMIIDALEETSPVKKDEKLKELLGHKPVEVFAGAVLGVVVAIIYNFLIGI